MAGKGCLREKEKGEAATGDNPVRLEFSTGMWRRGRKHTPETNP